MLIPGNKSDITTDQIRYMSVELVKKLLCNLPHLIWQTSLSVQLPVLRHPRHSFSPLVSCRSMVLSVENSGIDTIIQVIVTVDSYTKQNPII